MAAACHRFESAPGHEKVSRHAQYPDSLNSYEIMRRSERIQNCRGAPAGILNAAWVRFCRKARGGTMVLGAEQLGGRSNKPSQLTLGLAPPRLPARPGRTAPARSEHLPCRPPRGPAAERGVCAEDPPGPAAEPVAQVAVPRNPGAAMPETMRPYLERRPAHHAHPSPPVGRGGRDRRDARRPGLAINSLAVAAVSRRRSLARTSCRPAGPEPGEAPAPRSAAAARARAPGWPPRGSRPRRFR